MRRVLFFVPLAIAAALMGIAARFLFDEERVRTANVLPSVLVGSPAPEIDLPPIEGMATGGLNTSDLARSDEVTAVNLFASWCGPCREEHGVLTRLVEENDLRLLGINIADPPEDAATFLNDLGNPYELIGADRQGRARVEWGTTGVPETFLVSPDGTIVFHYRGPILGEPAVSDFRRALEEARGAMEGGA